MIHTLSTIRPIVDASTAADRWAGSAGTAQQRYVEGIQNTQADPAARAIAAEAKLLSGFQQSVTSGRWRRRLSAVGKSGWQQAAIQKAPNFATGFNASKDKYMQAIGPVLAIESQLQAQIQSMPNASFQDSINRMTAWATGLHNWAQNR